MLKPVLAIDAPDTATLARLIKTHTLFAAPKIDGFRCIIDQGQAFSRSGKLFPNPAVQACAATLPHGTDCELIFGPPTAPNAFSATQGGATSKAPPAPGLRPRFYAFDNQDLGGPWLDRIMRMNDQDFGAHGEAIEHHYIEDIDHLHELESGWLKAGYEGVAIRDASALYRPGKPSKSGLAPLMRLKRFTTSEARIIDHTLENVTLSAPEWPQPFIVTQGLEHLPTGVRMTGQTVSFNHFPHGAKDAPRHAILKGLRPALDL